MAKVGRPSSWDRRSAALKKRLTGLRDKATIRGVSRGSLRRSISRYGLDRAMTDLAFKVLANEVIRGWR